MPASGRKGTAPLSCPAMGGIPVTGVSELVLVVADLDAAERFYAGVLGLPVVERWQQRSAVWVRAGERTRLGLWLGPQVGIAGGRGGAHVHFALHIAPEDYDGAVARLRRHGFEPHEELFPAYDRSRSTWTIRIDSC